MSPFSLCTLFLCVCVPHACLEARREHQIPKHWVIEDCELSHGCWKLNPILCESSKCSSPLSHLSAPLPFSEWTWSSQIGWTSNPQNPHRSASIAPSFFHPQASMLSTRLLSHLYKPTGFSGRSSPGVHMDLVCLLCVCFCFLLVSQAGLKLVIPLCQPLKGSSWPLWNRLSDEVVNNFFFIPGISRGMVCGNHRPRCRCREGVRNAVCNELGGGHKQPCNLLLSISSRPLWG